jgi:putative IMPACT (imprinted ancient) family translation regulator
MEIIDEYKTITSTPAEGFYSEKRSKFYAFAHHVETEEQVKDIVQTYRKRFYDARHVCYAFMLGADSSLFRTNDDGEPSSTAGKPILGQIVKNELTNILIIVVRYFGGVKLGTSGLLVAYKTAARPCRDRNLPGGGRGGVQLSLRHDERRHAHCEGDEATHRVAKLRQHMPDNLKHQKVGS